MKVKKILCITENLGSGGAERQLTGLAVLFRQAGYDVKFITYINKQFYLDYLLENDVEYELLSQGGNKYTRVYYLYRAFRQFSPDVVISFLPSVNISVCLTRLFLKFKLIVSERSATRSVSLKDRIKFLLYRRADYVVANSYSETERIVALFPSLRAKSRTITNFIDTGKFCPAVNQQTNPGVVRILSVGRIIPLKNILNYIRAVRLVLDKGFPVRATWVGDNYDREYYGECRALVEELGLGHHMMFKPQTRAIVGEYQKADIFCLSSFYEGFPNVICEAMACGLPVVCSHVCDHPKIVEQGINGFLFDPQSVDEIGEALMKCIKSDRIAMGIQNRDAALNKFGSNKFVHSFITLLE